MLRIGTGSSCGACRPEEGLKLAESGSVDYLVFDRLAERTTAELALSGSRGGERFDPELRDYMRMFLPHAARGVRLITNAGGEDPEAAVAAAVGVARELGLKGLKFGAMRTKDVLDSVIDVDPVLIETGQRLSSVDSEVMGATLYVGAKPIVDALDQGADVVITGRVGDSTLYLAPMIHEYKWGWDEWNLLGQGMSLGHCMECGPQVTGGYYASPPYKQVPDLATVGLPICEVGANGEGVITQLDSSGGKVTVPIVKEQILYEVGDPARYVHPDVVVDWTTVGVEQAGENRVRVAGATGHPRPDTLKVLVAVKEGYVAESYVQFGGSDCLDRAKYAAEVVQRRLDVMGIQPKEFRAAFIGVDSLFAPWGSDPVVPREVMLHLAGRFETREEAERFRWDCFMGAGNHYGPAAGTPGRNLVPIDETPTVYSCLVPRSAMPEPELVMMEVR